MALLDVDQLVHQVSRKGASAGGAVAKHYLRWIGLPIAAPLVAFMDVWDHMLRRDQLTTEYSKEIAAKLGKEVENITPEDMKEVAKENPTIAEAYGRSKRKRNMDMAINVGCTVAVFVIVAALIPHISVILAGAIGFCGYYAASYVLDKIGSKLFGLSEPSIKKVEKNPALQEQLSVPSQVLYLERLQKKRINITTDQITTLFNKAKTEVSSIDAQMWANKLNDGLIDATEMAFIVCGQRSNVPERDMREPSRFDRINAEWQKDMALAKDKLRDAGDLAKDKAGVVKDKAMDLAGSVKDKTAEIGDKANKFWQEKVRRNGDNASAISPDAILADRELQAQSSTPPL